MIDLSVIGGVAGANAILAPIITRYFKALVPKKSTRALLSPLVGFVLTTLVGFMSGMDIGGALTLGLAGLAGGGAGSSGRDFLKHVTKKTTIKR